MADKLKEIPAKILEWWNKFTTRQKSIIIGAAAVVIFALSIAVFRKVSNIVPSAFFSFSASIPVREVGDTVAVPFTLFKAVIAEISILINHVLPHIYSGAAIRSPVIKTRQLTDRSPVLLMPWTCWRQMPWNWLHRICWHR